MTCCRMCEITEAELAAACRERDEARQVARQCWHAWRLYADMNGPPGVSPAYREAVSVGEQFPWLKETDER